MMGLSVDKHAAKGSKFDFDVFYERCELYLDFNLIADELPSLKVSM